MIFTSTKAKQDDKKNDLTPKLELNEEELEVVSGEDKRENVCGDCPKIILIEVINREVVSSENKGVTTQDSVRVRNNVEQTNLHQRYVRKLLDKNKQAVSVKEM